MPDTRSVGAIGVLVATLALASLAAQPDAVAPSDAPPARPPARPAEPTTEQLRALGEGRRIDLNRASAGDLQLLPGIGPALAGRIVDDRRSHGPYRTIEELARVRGIGRRRVAEIRPLVEVTVSVLEKPDHAERHREMQGIGVERSR